MSGYIPKGRPLCGLCDLSVIAIACELLHYNHDNACYIFQFPAYFNCISENEVDFHMLCFACPYNRLITNNTFKMINNASSTVLNNASSTVLCMHVNCMKNH